jgi:hypothetical protein
MKNLVKCTLCESLECFLAFASGSKCQHRVKHRLQTLCLKTTCSIRSPITYEAKCVEVKENDNS